MRLSKLLTALAIVVILLALSPQAGAPPTSSEEEEVIITTTCGWLEVNVTAPREAVEGDELEITVTVKALAALQIEWLQIWFCVNPDITENPQLEPGSWLTLDSVDLAEDVSVPSGWTTTFTRRIRNPYWGDLVLAVVLNGWRIVESKESSGGGVSVEIGVREYASGEWYIPVVKVKPKELVEYEYIKENYTRLKKYERELAMYKSLAEKLREEIENLRTMYGDLQLDYSELNSSYVELVRNYTLLMSNYRSLQDSYETLGYEVAKLRSEVSMYKTLCLFLAVALIVGLPLTFILSKRHEKR